MKKLLVLLVLTVFTLTAGAADDGITGRWASAADAPIQVKLSIAKVGELYSISHSWTGPTAMLMNTQNYIATGQGAQGTLEADPKGKSMGSAPRKLAYVLKGNTLILKVAEGDFSGEHRLTRTLLTTPEAAKALAKAQKKKSPLLTPASLLGTWQTDEGAALQAAMTFAKGTAEGELMVTQQWADTVAMSMSYNDSYQLVQQDHRRTLQAKNPKKNSPELSVLGFELDGDVLLITLPGGHHAGTHLLRKMAK